jgi:hypothetical protein
MPKAKPLSKEMILAAMSQTKSNRAACRYLNVSYIHYKRWAKLYESDTHKNLFEQHKNQSGKGIPKFLRSKGKEPALIDIIEGRVDASSFSPDKIKYRLITEGHLLEECNTFCSMLVAFYTLNELRGMDRGRPFCVHTAVTLLSRTPTS